MTWFIVIIGVCFLFSKETSSQDIFETVEAVVGRNAELPCNVTAELADDKLNILAWYINGSSAAFYSSRDLRGGEEIPSSSGGRYQLVTGDSDGLDKLQILNVRPSDGGIYQCLADFAASPAHKTFVQLKIIEPPRDLWVIYENSTQVAKASAGVNISRNIGPYYVGDTVRLFCVAYGGKPRASLEWWSDQDLLKDTYTPISEQRVRSDLMYGPLRSEDHGKVLTCAAKNNDKTTPLSIDVVIEMYLPPELVSLRSETHESGRVNAGEVLNLQCRVLGARPPPHIIWRLEDNQLLHLQQDTTWKSSQRLLINKIQLSVDRDYDEKSITCCASAYTRDDDNKYICAEKLPLTVLYPPVLEIVLEEEYGDNKSVIVRKGSDLRMACSYQANPDVTELIWYHEWDPITNKDGTEPVKKFLILSNISETDSGEYVCAGTNDVELAYSEPININVTYPPVCEDSTLSEYGLSNDESINITCNVRSYPEPTSYRWVIVDDAVNITTMHNYRQTLVETEDGVLLFQRTNSTIYSTIFCWGINDVPTEGLLNTPCTFLVSDETMPRPPVDCGAVKNKDKDIIITCQKGHDGGLPQKFKFVVKSIDSDDNFLSITNQEPEFMIPEPKQDFKFVILAYNEKGESKTVEIQKEDIVDETEETSVSTVSNITTLSLALFGGVLLVALAACGLVLCAHDRDSRLDLPRQHSDPPLCAYNTEESNCDTFHGSDDGSECNVRRTESFRKAVSRYPSKNFDVRRTSSFHSARYMNEVEPEVKCSDTLRHSNHCRVHSMQNISRKREMDALCDHLVLHLPPETNYNVPKPMNTFYTMPRKSRQKISKEISDETSEITQTSDGFSLPPPPDEFGTYRAATRIRDIPTKSMPSYTTIKRNNSGGKEPLKQQYCNMIAPMNTVGIPTISGMQNSVYTYPDEDGHGHQDSQASGIQTTIKTIYARESGF